MTSVLPSDIFAYGSASMPGYDGSITLNGSIAGTTVATPTVTANVTFPPASKFPILIDCEILWVRQGAARTAGQRSAACPRRAPMAPPSQCRAGIAACELHGCPQ